MHLHLILGVIAAVWVYQDAQKFGYGKNAALLWALGNVVFVFVFFPLYLLLGRKPQIKRRKITEQTIDVEAEELDAADAVECPMCARSVRESFNLCPYCGYTLRLICENCGKELQREWKVCPYCQTKTPEK